MYQYSHHVGLFWTQFPGMGFNVANSKPTLCVNDLILDLNEKKQKDLKPLRVEEVIAWTMNVLEKMIEDFQRDGHLPFCDRYYKKWLHRWDVYHAVCVSTKAACRRFWSNCWIDTLMCRGKSFENFTPSSFKESSCGTRMYLKLQSFYGSKWALNPSRNSFEQGA